MTPMRPPLWMCLAWTAACAPPNAATPYPKAEPPAGVDAAAPEPETPAEPTPTPVVARYFDRELDLRPFLVGFPYGDFHPSLRTGALYYLELGDRYTLRMLDVGEQAGAIDRFELAKGKAIGDADWSKRSLWSLHHHAPTQTLWLHADASNDEKMNLWTLSLETGALTQVTDHDYVYGFGFSDDDGTIAYLPRKGTKAPYETCLVVRKVDTGATEEIVCDSPKLAFTWGTPRFSPDGKHVALSHWSKGGYRDIWLVDVASGAVREVTLPLRVDRLPEAPPAVLGVADYRGAVVPVVDLRLRFGLGPSPEPRLRVAPACRPSCGPRSASVTAREHRLRAVAAEGRWTGLRRRGRAYREACET